MSFSPSCGRCSLPDSQAEVFEIPRELRVDRAARLLGASGMAGFRHRQWLTYLDPVRYFLVIIRATFLKDVGRAILWPQLLALLALGTALMSLAVLRFRKSLD